MNGIEYALRHLHDGENALYLQLLRVAERHHAEHEVHHVARDLAAWSAEHVTRIAHTAQAHDVELSAAADQPTPTTERPERSTILLEDLRSVYLQASDNSLAWEMLAQVAQAKHARDLMGLSAECHPQTLRQIRWANTMLKTQTPQILSSLS